MPLTQSPSKAAFKENVSRETKDAKRPLKQALAIAYSVQRKNRANGGGVTHPGGFLTSHVPGRTDHLPLNVESGSYVVPADVVSGLGEGNSLAGKNVLAKMFGGDIKDLPYTPAHRARGGAVPIMAAGGEVVITPKQLKKKFGNLGHAHKIMDSFVKGARKKTIKTLKGLPGPAQGHEKS